MGNLIVTAIIAAGGSGKRFGNTVKKQFVELVGKPVLYHSLSRFSECSLVSDIVLALPEAEVETYGKNIKELGLFKKIKHIIPGGINRQDSVYRAFCMLSDKTDIVVVHDAARPLINIDMIESSILAAQEQGSAICAVKVKDTVKQTDESNLVQNTLNRESLWLAQTPQAFRYNIIKKAYENALEHNYIGTDESSLVEKIGHRPRIINGSQFNIKITDPSDVELAKAFLEVIKCTE